MCLAWKKNLLYVFHDNGSNLRDQGVSVEDICELLGHNDAEFTRRTYALPLENTHKKAIDFYEEKFKRKLVNFFVKYQRIGVKMPVLYFYAGIFVNYKA